MTLLADNDIILKLAHCDLLAQAVALLGGPAAEVYVLGTARYKLLPKNRGKGNIPSPGDPAYLRLQAFFAVARTVEATPDQADVRLLVDEFQIDEGEAVLFAAAGSYPGCHVATGDKRALATLAALGPAGHGVRDRLAGRVVCLEYVLVQLIDALGFTDVLNRVVPAREYDTVLRAVFNLDSTEASVRAGLTSYIAALRTDAPGLLVP